MSALRMDDRGVIGACPSCGKQNRLAFARLGHPARCAQCHAGLPAASAPVQADATAAFDAVVRQSPVPVLVDFWAPWCGPCHSVAPQIDEVARRNAGRLVVVKVNIDNLQDVAARLGIKSIPTLAVFAHGREAARTAGAMSADQIEAFVRQAGA
ncbi:MAG: thioredoxin [Acidobacteriota bacterium]|nr:thioredoxin [Acidobacteriota bacterium]